MLGRFGRVVVVDVVAFEATDADRPWADVIGAWLEQGQRPGSNDPLEVAPTDIGAALRLARQADPNFRLRHGGETAIVQWLGEHVAELAGGALVVYENGRVPSTVRREGLDIETSVITTRALLELAQAAGFIDSSEKLWRLIEHLAPTANPLSSTTTIRPISARSPS